MYIKTKHSDNKEILIRQMNALKNQEFIIYKGKNSIILIGRIEIGQKACNFLYKQIKAKVNAEAVYSEIDSLEPYKETVKPKEVINPAPKNVFEKPSTVWNIEGIPHKKINGE